MNQYISSTEYAVKQLIKLITIEERSLKEHENQLQALEKHHEFLYEDFLRKDFDPDDHFNEYQLMNAFSKQAQFAAKIESIKKQMSELKLRIDTHDFSYRVLAGSILQIAKQGISVVHHRLRKCPDGRFIGSETLKNVIWQGRNQSLHFEEGDFKQPVFDCFLNLENSFGSMFSLTVHTNKNLAKEIIDILNWQTYENYKNDMILLLG